MALHTDLPIHRTGVQLLQFAFKAQEHMPRGVKRSLGDKIADVCVEMLDQMALANATRGAERAGHLHCQLNPRKTILQPADRGIDFVGQQLKPWCRTTRRRTLRAALQRIEHQAPADLLPTGNSYLGLAGQASEGHTQRARIARALLRRGHCVAADLHKAYRRAA